MNSFNKNLTPVDEVVEGRVVRVCADGATVESSGIAALRFHIDKFHDDVLLQVGDTVCFRPLVGLDAKVTKILSNH